MRFRHTSSPLERASQSIVRIPTKSATYSNMYPATDSDFIPDAVPT